MINRATRERLLASTIIAGAFVAAPAMAQDTAAPATTAATAADTAAPTGGDIVVTGSLIRNPNIVSSSPVAVVGQQEMQLRQSSNAEELLRDLPGAVPAIGSAVNNGNGGQSFVDLRGLGSNRNVVLLDGTRIVPGDSLGRTDLNNIPLALIESTQALTGGAATTYGADAVAGVVNFITRKDFAGVELSAGEKLNQQGDGAAFRVDLTIGANFDDGRGNAVFSVGYQKTNPVYQGDRAFSLFNIDGHSGATGAAAGSGTTVPARFSVPGQGTLQINPTTGALGTTFQLYNFNPYNIFLTPFKRFNMYGAGHYDVSDSLTVYSQGFFSKNITSTIVAASGIFGSSITMPYSNPYLPVAARNQFCAANGLTTGQCTLAAAATSASDPNYRTFSTVVSRRTPDVGNRVDTFTTQEFNYRAGATYTILSNLKLDAWGAYGESEIRQARIGYVLLSRVRDAALATNTTTCLSNNTGCVPVNLFGGDGSITPAQAGYLANSSYITSRTSLAQAHAQLTGDFGKSTPWANENVNFAIGGEYRKYTFARQPDTLAQSAGELGGAGGAITNFSGAYDVVEGFAEVIAPIVQDKAFFHDLTLEGGVRRSHYRIFAGSNPSFNTTTWKAAGSWSPVDGIKLRADYQHAVRAPNIFELFSPFVTGLTALGVDPCASRDTSGKPIPGVNAPTPGSSLYNVCIAQGASASNIATIQQPSAQQANATAGGSLALKPEKADSYTLGLVLNPKEYVPGLTIGIDYYHIKIKDAITAPTSGDLISACFGGVGTAAYNPPASAATSAACTVIRRNPTTGGLDGDAAVTPGLRAPLSNQGLVMTDGIDLDVGYRRNLGFAKLNLNFRGNYTAHSKFKATPTSIYRECVGYFSPNCGGAAAPTVGSIQPKYTWNQRTTLTFDTVDFSLLWRHINKVKQEPLDLAVEPGFVGTLTVGPLAGKKLNFQKVPNFDYFDFSTHIEAGDHFDFTFTVANLFNKKPPVIGTGVGTTSFNSGNTYPSTYDALGRRFEVGGRLKF